MLLSSKTFAQINSCYLKALCSSTQPGHNQSITECFGATFRPNQKHSLLHAFSFHISDIISNVIPCNHPLIPSCLVRLFSFHAHRTMPIFQVSHAIDVSIGPLFKNTYSRISSSNGSVWDPMHFGLLGPFVRGSLQVTMKHTIII